MRHMRWLPSGALLMVLITLVASCARDTAAPGTRPEIQMARGGPSGGGTKGGPVVSATDPKGAPQNITLDVRVLGSGFDLGSRVSFERGGVPSAKVVTNSMSFIISTELVANVTIAADADTAKYDVAVLTTKGIKGIGSVLFEVVGDPPATWLIPTTSGLSLNGDGKYMQGEYSAYRNGTCGVSAGIFATLSASNSGDAVLSTVNKRFADRKCVHYPRKVVLTYPDGVTESSGVHANLHAIQNTSYNIPIGTTVTRPLNMDVSAGATRCGSIKFRTVDNAGTYLGADSLQVTRVNSFTWDVQTKPYPNNKAYCINTGQLYHLDIRFRIESELAMP